MTERKTWLKWPGRPGRCWFSHCTKPVRPGDRVVLIGDTCGHFKPLHLRHRIHLAFVSRARLWRKGPPDIVQEFVKKVSNFTIYGRYLVGNQIVVTQNFWELDSVHAVYLLSHETLHWVLTRDFGLVVSNQWDGVYYRRLRCLGGKSLFTFEIQRLGGVLEVRVYSRSKYSG